MIEASVVRTALIGILGAAAIAKMMGFGSFVESLRRYRLLPPPATTAVAVLVVALESLLAFLLLAGVQVHAALLGAGALMAAFAAVTALTLRRAGSIECGCLGSAAKLRLGRVSVAANMLAALAAVAASTAPVQGLPFPADERAPATTIVVLWMTGVAWAGLYWLSLLAGSVLTSVDEALTEAGP